MAQTPPALQAVHSHPPRPSGPPSIELARAALLAWPRALRHLRLASSPSLLRRGHRAVAVYKPLRRACDATATCRLGRPGTDQWPPPPPPARCAAPPPPPSPDPRPQVRAPTPPHPSPPRKCAAAGGARSDPCVWLVLLCSGERRPRGRGGEGTGEGEAGGRPQRRCSYAPPSILSFSEVAAYVACSRVVRSLALICVLLWIALCRPRRTRRPRRLDPSQAGKILTCASTSLHNRVWRDLVADGQFNSLFRCH
jgi:hypothetical protein